MKSIYNINLSPKLKIFSFLLITIGFFSSCEKEFLEVKPDKQMVVPTTLKDSQHLLDNNFMNSGYPYSGESSADNYYLDFTSWNALELRDREEYIWDPNAKVNVGQWNSTYVRILYSNQVLEILGENPPNDNTQSEWNQLKGSALFYRAFSLFHAAQLWAKPFNPSTAEQDLGIPIRLTPSITEETSRGTVQKTYDQIITDLREAIDLLPTTSAIQTRPNKMAAFAALARIFLSMGDYQNAFENADNALNINNDLIDFSELDSTASFPFNRFNQEVIFQAVAGYSANLAPWAGNKVDSTLYDSYEENDLRKIMFFQDNGDGSYSFKGNYDQNPSAILFCGLATDELYLIRAECYARAGDTEAALKDLNDLLTTRWNGDFINFTAADSKSALGLIIKERRKELLFRTLRWTDLRRLNQENGFEITLTRSLDGQTYSLPPNDLRYVLPIPQEVLNITDIPQNPR